MDAGHALLDVGGGARLERFGARVTDRPHPGALGARGDPGGLACRRPALRPRSRLERRRRTSREPWPIEIDGLTLELRATEAGQVGLFPEHAAMLPWLRERVAARTRRPATDPRPTPPAVLHLFAYTGLATLALAAAGASVVHVDASRPTVAWARRNAERSGLADRPIRWIVDDARAFAEREVRRGRRYAGVVLDPPSYGHGPGSGAWRIERRPPGAPRRDRRPARAGRVRPADRPHARASRTTGSRTMLGRALAAAGGDDRSAVRLELTTADGRRLALGAFARSPAGHDVVDGLPHPAGPDELRQPPGQGGDARCATGASATGPA